MRRFCPQRPPHQRRNVSPADQRGAGTTSRPRTGAPGPPRGALLTRPFPPRARHQPTTSEHRRTPGAQVPAERAHAPKRRRLAPTLHPLAPQAGPRPRTPFPGRVSRRRPELWTVPTTGAVVKAPRRGPRPDHHTSARRDPPAPIDGERPSQPPQPSIRWESGQAPACGRPEPSTAGLRPADREGAAPTPPTPPSSEHVTTPSTSPHEDYDGTDMHLTRRNDLTLS